MHTYSLSHTGQVFVFHKSTQKTNTDLNKKKRRSVVERLCLFMTDLPLFCFVP